MNFSLKFPFALIDILTVNTGTAHDAEVLCMAHRQERMQNRMDKDRAEMLDRVDALTAALSSAAEERRRTVRELDDRAEAIRK